MVARALYLHSHDTGIDPASFDPSRFDARLDGILADLRRRGRTLGVHRRAENAARFDSLLRKLHDEGYRFDSLAHRMDSGQNGLHLARDLDHRYAEVLREAYPRKNGFLLFPVDSSVPVGARTHTVSRLYSTGSAKVYRAGESIPRVGVSQAEEQFPIRHYVTSFGYSLFDALSAGFANFPLAAELLRTARDVMEEFANRMIWYGSTSDGIYGVLSYPWLDKAVDGVANFYEDGAVSADDLIDRLNYWLDWSKNNSSATFSPNAVAMSPRVRNFLAGKRRANTDTSALKWWLDNKASGYGISTVSEAWELQSPTGAPSSLYDGILFYRNDRQGIANVVPAGFTTLPVQENGFDSTTYAYMSHGGVIMRNVGNNLLVWVKASA